MARATITIGDDVRRRLRRIAADRGVSMATIIREAIDEMADRLAPRPRSLGIGESGVRDSARRSGEERPEPRS